MNNNTQRYTHNKKVNGDIFKMVFNDLHSLKKFKNVLLIRTPTTASWMDTMLMNDNTVNTVRIIYNIVPDIYNVIKKSNYIHLNHDDLEDFIKNLNIKFDAICIDPFHEYKESTMDFTILSRSLSEEGIMISHDCYPPKKEYSTTKFKDGYWCGVTYICFIELAYNNPQWFYSIINNDNGVGILSKTFIPSFFDDKKFDRMAQEKLISLKEYNTAYDYFIENKNQLMNIIEEF